LSINFDSARSLEGWAAYNCSTAIDHTEVNETIWLAPLLYPILSRVDVIMKNSFVAFSVSALVVLGGFAMANPSVVVAQDNQSGSIYSNGQLPGSTPGVTQFQENGFQPNGFNPATKLAPKPRTLPGTQGSTLKPMPQSNPGPSSPFGSQVGSNSSSSFRSASEPRSTAQTVSENEISMPVCSVEFIDNVMLPAQEAGKLQEVFIKEGEAVPTGKIVALIDDRLLRSSLREAQLLEQQALEKATDEISKQAAEAEFRLSSNEYETARNLGRKGSQAQNEVARAGFQKDIAKLKYRAAIRDGNYAADEAAVAKAQADRVRERIELHRLRVEFDGYVIKLLKQDGEWCQAGEPVMQVARLDRLYVQGNLAIDVANPHEVLGKTVIVEADMARGETMTFEGRVTNVGLANTDTGKHYMVKAEVTNKFENGQWLLRKGSSVAMKIKTNSNTASTSSEMPSR
jgi:hypothetical protein